MVAEMPRNKKRTFIGPILPHNPPKSKEPKEERPKKIKAKVENPEFYILERYMKKSGLRDSIVDGKGKNSVAVWCEQRKWLNRNQRVLGEFQRMLNRQELERQKDIARQGGHTRRLRILENGHSYYTEAQVLERWGTDCHICHEPVDLKASRRVGIGDWWFGLHIEHFLAVANGGPDTLDNVRPSHGICNLRKSTKLF